MKTEWLVTNVTPDNFTQECLMKTEWFVINVTPVGSPDRAKHTILGLILSVFWPIQACGQEAFLILM